MLSFSLGDIYLKDVEKKISQKKGQMSI